MVKIRTDVDGEGNMNEDVIQLKDQEIQTHQNRRTRGIMTDEMTFTLLKPLAQNSIINNLTASLGGIPDTTQIMQNMIMDQSSPHEKTTLEFDNSTTAFGSRPSSSKFGIKKT